MILGIGLQVAHHREDAGAACRNAAHLDGVGTAEERYRAPGTVVTALVSVCLHGDHVHAVFNGLGRVVGRQLSRQPLKY